MDDGSVDGSAQIARRLRRRRPAGPAGQPAAPAGSARPATRASARRPEEAPGVLRRGRHGARCGLRATRRRAGGERLGHRHRVGHPAAAGTCTRSRPGPSAPTASAASGCALDDHPEIMANLMPGTRVFRRAFWDEQGLAFATEGDHSDIVTIVDAMLRARRIDILPVGGLPLGLARGQPLAVAAGAPGPAPGRRPGRADLRRRRAGGGHGQRARAAGVLRRGAAHDRPGPGAGRDHPRRRLLGGPRRRAATGSSTWSPPRRSPTCRSRTGSSPGCARTTSGPPPRASWSTPSTTRTATRTGWWATGRTSRCRSSTPSPRRLTSSPASPTASCASGPGCWWCAGRRPDVLHLEGAAFLEYLDDSYAASEVTLVLRDRASGRTWRVPTTPTPEPNVNQWSQRAHEDHSGGAFSCDVDVSTLPSPDAPRHARAVLEVQVELRIGEHQRTAGFHSRAVNVNAGLLETSTVGGTTVEPRWTPARRAEHRAAAARRHAPTSVRRSPTGPVRVAEVTASGGVVRLSGSTDRRRGDRPGRSPRAHRLVAGLPHGRGLRGRARRVRRRVGRRAYVAAGRPVRRDGPHRRRPDARRRAGPVAVAPLPLPRRGLATSTSCRT